MATNIPTAPIGIVTPGPIVNPSPKNRFRLTKGFVGEHRAMLESPAFDRALDFAMLQYQLQAGAQIQDTNGGLAYGYKLLGVQEFVAVLRTLSEEVRIETAKNDENLNHRA